MASVEQPLARTARELADYVVWTPAGRRIAASATTSEPVAFLRELIDQGAYVDANRAIAFLLPNRKACWWALLCIWHATAERLSDDELRAIDAGLCWIVDPTREHRETAGAIAESAGSTTAAGCLAKAISIADCGSEPDRLPRAARPELAARLCLTAVLAAYFEGGRQRSHRQAFSVIGFEVLSGRHHWELPPGAVNRSNLPHSAEKGVS